MCIRDSDKSADRFDIYLDEKKVQLKEDKTNPDIISYGFGAVSYTHLDVYKRQEQYRSLSASMYNWFPHAMTEE